MKRSRRNFDRRSKANRWRVWFRLFGRRSLGYCVYCRRPLTFGEATTEHKKPLGRGGHNGLGNLTIACRECNQRRNAEDQARGYRQVTA